ncbi:Protein CMSS1, partial [Microtus ochrogaster]
KISDILAKSEPKPGTPGDLQKLIKDHYSGSRSIVELEELNLPVCPKWVKLRKTHNEKKSVLMLIICSSAIRALELIRSLTAFKGDAKVMKLFAKHIKVQEQVNLLEKRVIHLGVGTPGRIKQLVKQDGLNLNPLKFLVFDWNWRDQKLRRMMDIPEVMCNQLLSLIFFFSQFELEFKPNNKVFGLRSQHILALEIISVFNAEVTIIEPSHPLTHNCILPTCNIQSAWSPTK